MNKKNIYSLLLLFAFCFFLVTPALVKLVQHNADISIFYTFSEEEHQEEHNGKEKVETFFSLASTSFISRSNYTQEPDFIHAPYFKAKLVTLRSFVQPPEA